MGAIPSGKGRERFPQLQTNQKARFRGIWGGGAAGGDVLLLLWSGRSEGKKGRVGEKRPARAQDIGLVAPSRMARQTCRTSACGATARATSEPAWPTGHLAHQ